MMREFVDGDMGHEVLDRHIAAFAPFIQDGFPEQPDRIWPHRLIEHRFFRHGDAVIKPGQIQRILDLKLAQHVVIGPVHNADRDLQGRAAKRCGQAIHRAAGHVFDLVETGQSVHHAPDMACHRRN